MSATFGVGWLWNLQNGETLGVDFAFGQELVRLSLECDDGVLILKKKEGESHEMRIYKDANKKIFFCTLYYSKPISSSPIFHVFMWIYDELMKQFHIIMHVYKHDMAWVRYMYKKKWNDDDEWSIWEDNFLAQSKWMPRKEVKYYIQRTLHKFHRKVHNFNHSIL